MNCVTRSNSPFSYGSSVALPTLQLERRVALPPLRDPVLHQVDPMALAGTVLAQPVQEVAAAAADVEHARAGERDPGVARRHAAASAPRSCMYET